MPHMLEHADVDRWVTGNRSRFQNTEKSKPFLENSFNLGKSQASRSRNAFVLKSFKTSFGESKPGINITFSNITLIFENTKRGMILKTSFHLNHRIPKSHFRKDHKL